MFTEDAKLGIFDKLPKCQELCQSEFILRGRRQSHVGVGRRTGVLTLRKNLRSLRKDSRGIRKLTMHILLKKRCYGREPKSALRSRTVNVELIIFPSFFGDRLLRHPSVRRVSASIQHSNVFRNARPSSLLRVVRFVTRKIERKGVDKMLASIKVSKILEFVINEIVKRHVPNSKSELMLTRYIQECFLLIYKKSFDLSLKFVSCMKIHVVSSTYPVKPGLHFFLLLTYVKESLTNHITGQILDCFCKRIHLYITHIIQISM